MQISEAARQSRIILDALQEVIIGKEQAIQYLLLGLYRLVLWIWTIRRQCWCEQTRLKWRTAPPLLFFAKRHP